MYGEINADAQMIFYHSGMIRSIAKSAYPIVRLCHCKISLNNSISILSFHKKNRRICYKHTPGFFCVTNPNTHKSSDQ